MRSDPFGVLDIAALSLETISTVEKGLLSMVKVLLILVDDLDVISEFLELFFIKVVDVVEFFIIASITIVVVSVAFHYNKK